MRDEWNAIGIGPESGSKSSSSNVGGLTLEQRQNLDRNLAHSYPMINGRRQSNNTNSNISTITNKSTSSASSSKSTPTSHEHGLDRGASLTMAHMAMKQKNRGERRKGGSLANVSHREVSERRQVGDAAGMVNPSSGKGLGEPWWKNVDMEEKM